MQCSTKFSMTVQIEILSAETSVSETNNFSEVI